MGPLFIIPPNSSSSHNHHNNVSAEHDSAPDINDEKSTFYKPQNNSQLRKYVVLLQDCVAIKFMREESEQPHHHVKSDITPISDSLTPSLPPQLSSSSSSSASSLEGLQLFKLFRDSNLKATWNPPTTSAINSLTYKGFITPSTILLTSPSKSALNTLRTAYSRRILRNPPGYRIELLAEIDEIVAQPVQQGQFTPLSDSLCWAIVELRAGGNEAFVDSIVGALGGAFPGVSGPPKELVYRTLEKLIRERRVYQSSSGYHVVGPEVSEYMESVMVGRGGGCCAAGSGSDYFGHTQTFTHDPDDQVLRRPTRSTTSVNEQRRTTSLLKRHNSLKMIRQQDNPQPHVHQPSMGARSLSFRLSKVNSLFDSDKEEDEEDVGRDYYECEEWRGRRNVALEEPPSAATKKRRSFLRRWFYDSFRKLKQKPPNPPLSKSTSQLNIPIQSKYNSLPSHNRPTTRPQLSNDTFKQPKPTPRPPSPSPSTISTSTAGIYSSIPPSRHILTRHYPRVFQRYKKPTRNHEIIYSGHSTGQQSCRSSSYSTETTSSSCRRRSSVVVVSSKVVDGEDRCGSEERCSSDDVSH